MFLSRLTLNPRSRAVWHDLADCCSMHRTIMFAFPGLAGDAARARLGVLFRLESAPGGGPVLLLQSEAPPDWSRLPAGYLVRPPESKPLSPLFAAFDAGRLLRFRLRANPTRKIMTGSGLDGSRSNGKRVELRTEAEWLAWLERKAAQHGFRLVSARAAPAVPDVQTAKQGKITGARAEAQPLTLFAVQFEGRLIIQDLALFLAALRNGIGPGKAYGFGLLSVAPE